MPAGLRAGLIQALQPCQYPYGRQKNSYELPLPGKHCPGGKYRCQRVNLRYGIDMVSRSLVQGYYTMKIDTILPYGI